MFLKKSALTYLICLLFLILFTTGFAQEAISSEPLWMLILPGTISESLDQSLENEVTAIVADIAWESGRFEVFDRFDVMDLLMKYQPHPFGYLRDSVVMVIGDSTDCDEALIVDILIFSQIGIPPAEDEDEKEDRSFIESIIDGLFSSDSEDYSDNIHTRLTVQFRNLDMTTGKEIDRFSVRVSHTGGTKPESEEKALENFREVVFNEVRMIYQLVSKVVAVDGVNLDLRLGSNLGITGNTLFEIIKPGRVELAGDEEIVHPGKPAGLACVQSVGDTANRSQVIRQWGAIEPGYYAHEFNKKIHGIQLLFLPKFPGDYMYIGGEFHYSPLGVWDFGGGLHYISVTDSYDETDHGFGFSVFGSRKLLTVTSLAVYAKAGINLDIPFKKDDDGKTTTTGIFSGSLGISCSLMLTKKSDIEINLGYRLSTKSSHWTYNEDETEYDAFWLDEAPVIDLSGFFFTAGYKFILF
jgi:hypothetical protein